MKRNIINTLNIKTIEEIKDLARKQRLVLGYGEDTSIANDLQTVLEKEGITLIQYPIPSGNKKERPQLSAMLYCSDPFNYVCVNTADYYDKQVFAIAHELYHYYTKIGSRSCWQESNADDDVEIKANRFAAEFLLPESALKRRVVDEFSSYSLQNIQIQTVLRFIARLHCTWHLPYQSLVKRLREIDAITESQYQELYAIEERNSESAYYRIGRSTCDEIFTKLNTITNAVGTSAHAIETIVRNFEHNLIDEQAFSDTLKLFNKDPADFGYEISISQDALDEIDDFIRGWENES